MKWMSLSGSLRSALKILGLVVAVLAVVGGIWFSKNYYQQSLKPVSNNQKTVTIVIPKGASLDQVADILSKAKVIRKTWAFKQYMVNNNFENAIQAGTYAIKPSQSVQEIAVIITQGKVASSLVTIKPAQRIDQIEQSLINSGFNPDDVKAALDPAQYAGHPALVDKPQTANLEGYLYPESFQKTDQTKPQDIITASLDEMQKRLTPTRREAFVAQGLSVHKAIILASIVEREVPEGGERAQVAQVFLKRLNAGIKLQSDATSSYGAILDGAEPSLTYDSPYNTYNYVGLTPGPISNVSESSLQAVAQPASTDWLYFVSGDDGITYFSKTLQEHQALTAQHCNKLCN